MTNDSDGYQFSYPADTLVNDDTGTYGRMYFSDAPGTNLSEKYLELYVRDTSSGDVCSGSCTTVSGSEIFNRVSFLHQSGRDQGAGQIHEWDTFSTVMGDTCVIFNFIFHSGNPDMYYPTSLPVYDRTAETVVFQQMLTSFRWISSATPAPSTGLGSFSVVLVKSDDVLSIRAGAGYSTVDSFAYDATGVTSAGSSQAVVATPGAGSRNRPAGRIGSTAIT